MLTFMQQFRNIWNWCHTYALLGADRPIAISWQTDTLNVASFGKTKVLKVLRMRIFQILLSKQLSSCPHAIDKKTAKRARSKTSAWKCALNLHSPVFGSFPLWVAKWQSWKNATTDDCSRWYPACLDNYSSDDQCACACEVPCKSTKCSYKGSRLPCIMLCSCYANTTILFADKLGQSAPNTG